MDGVITDTMPVHCATWKTVFFKYGIHVTSEDIYSREGQKGIDSIKEIFALYNKPLTEDPHLILKEKEKLFQKRLRRKFIPGTRSLLRSLTRQKFLLALVTGTSRAEMQKLLPESIFTLFHVSVCGCDVRQGKPHPEPYEKALRFLSLSSKDAVVIENAPFGVRSAKRAGLMCLAVATSLPASYLHEADWVVGNIRELKQRFTFENKADL